MVQPMIKLRIISLLVICALLLPLHSVLHAQNEDVLTRERDESATTTEEREHALTVLLDAARQFRNNGELLEAARLMNRAGRLQLRLTRPQDALATYNEAQALLKQTPDT
jgi:hypothetical protein